MRALTGFGGKHIPKCKPFELWLVRVLTGVWREAHTKGLHKPKAEARWKASLTKGRDARWKASLTKGRDAR